MDTARKKDILHLAVRAGEIMMKSGAEIYRVEDTIVRICKACGVDNVEVFAMPTGIFVTLDNDLSTDSVSTYIRRIRSGETDLHKISLVNQFSREFTATDLSLEAGMQRLDEIEREKRYHFMVRVTAASVVAACFAVMFGGNAIDFCCAFITGTICYTLSRFLEKYEINFFIRGMCCCALAAFIALVIAASLKGASYGPIISGTIMLFVPGVAITNSIRDFLSGDMLAGLTRMVEAVLTAVSLAAGAGLVLKLWSLIGGITL
ncbi:MAG: threonine/serine exporter family protein [Firmicutes bacterium]|nr:threonine/serine exporter family protein [Bacillota bacterium]